MTTIHVLFDFFGTLVDYSASRTEQGYEHSFALLRTAMWAEFDAEAVIDDREFSMADATGTFLDRELVPKTSVEHGARKPDSSTFMSTLHKLGAAPNRCVYVGDDYEAGYCGAQPASRAGEPMTSPHRFLATASCLAATLLALTSACNTGPRSQLETAVSSIQASTAPYRGAEAGPFEVDVRNEVWHEEARDRKVPVRIYTPRGAEGTTPVILWSHGLGGTRETNAYLTERWASHGYVVVAMQHAGSDRATLTRGRLRRLRERFRAIYKDASAREARPRDASFVLDELERRAIGDGPLAGLLDVEHVGLAGHSFGAFTTLAVLGSRFELAPAVEDDGTRIPYESLADERFGVGIAMSPQGPGSFGLREDSWDAITRPFLLMTGINDKSFITGDASPRRIAFDRAHSVGRMHMTIEGAEHHAFGDAGLFGRRPRDPRHHGWIQEASTTWWDAHLRGDEAALAWLTNHSLEASSKGNVVMEGPKTESSSTSSDRF